MNNSNINNDSLNLKRQTIKDFVKNNLFKKDKVGHYIYSDTIRNKNLAYVAEQVLLNYGCLIYKDGYEQEKIKNIFSYYKEVSYLIKNYERNYICISEELNILKKSIEQVSGILHKDLPKNIALFMIERGNKAIDCVETLIAESETTILLNDICFLHNYVERGFDISMTYSIEEGIYKNHKDFLEELSESKIKLNRNDFNISLHYLKECIVYQRNQELKIIERFGFKREDLIRELSTTVNILMAYQNNHINENNIISEYFINWLEKKYKSIESVEIEKVQDLLERDVLYYTETNKSIPKLPNSLGRINEKIVKLSLYEDAIKDLSIENRELLCIQERIGKTVLFGIEHLSIEEREKLGDDILKIFEVYENMKKNGYGINKENKLLLEKKMMGIDCLREALSYLQMENQT